MAVEREVRCGEVCTVYGTALAHIFAGYDKALAEHLITIYDVVDGPQQAIDRDMFDVSKGIYYRITTSSHCYHPPRWAILVFCYCF